MTAIVPYRLVRQEAARPQRWVRSGARLPVMLTRDTGDEVTISSLPSRVGLGLYQGDDFYLTLYVTDSTGAPADLSRLDAQSQIRVSHASPISAVFDTRIISPLVYLHLPHAQASLLAPGRAVWDAQVSEEDELDPAVARVTTLCAGAVQVDPEVTR